MKLYYNKSTDCVLKEAEYNEMIVREYTNQWNEEYPNLIVLEFKEEEKTLQDYINYQLKYDIDTDFEMFESNLYDVMTFSEASEKWGLGESTLRSTVRTNRLIEGLDYRKSGKVWLITEEAMYRIYGEPKNEILVRLEKMVGTEFDESEIIEAFESEKEVIVEAVDGQGSNFEGHGFCICYNAYETTEDSEVYSIYVDADDEIVSVR